MKGKEYTTLKAIRAVVIIKTLLYNQPEPSIVLFLLVLCRFIIRTFESLTLAIRLKLKISINNALK